jgi:hypothetical protein
MRFCQPAVFRAVDQFIAQNLTNAMLLLLRALLALSTVLLTAASSIPKAYPSVPSPGLFSSVQLSAVMPVSPSASGCAKWDFSADSSEAFVDDYQNGSLVPLTGDVNDPSAMEIDGIVAGAVVLTGLTTGVSADASVSKEQPPNASSTASSNPAAVLR